MYWELGNIVGTYCGSEDEQLSDTKKVVTHFPRITCHLRAGIEEVAVSREITS